MKLIYNLHFAYNFARPLVPSLILSSILIGQTPAPSDIYVGNGYFSGEFYDFFTDSNGANRIFISDYVFYKGSTYTFHKISGYDTRFI